MVHNAQNSFVRCSRSSPGGKIMKPWIFQGNPDIFDLDGYISHTAEILWTLRQKHFADQIKPGDEVFLWRAAGSKSGLSGIIASTTVISNPSEMPDDISHRESR